MSDYTALGIPLEWKDEEGVTISPLSVLCISKGMDSDGNETYAVMNSEGLNNIDALGLLKYASLFIEDELRAAMYANYHASDG